MREHLVAICDGLKAGRFPNEASVVQGIVLRLLSNLGWPIYDTDTVAPEYSLESHRVDLALCNRHRKPIIFIEVKQVGQADGAERQLFEYAFHKGVPMVVLTDGKEWNFFLPAEQGDYDERRVYKLDLLERDLDECISRLRRYLAYPAVSSGEALEAARTDYRDVAKERQIRFTLPRAWHRLLEDEDGFLVELLTDKVESLCGYKPDTDVIAGFLKTQLQYPRPSTDLHTDTPPRTFRATPAQTTPPQSIANGGSKVIGFTFAGHEYKVKYARDVLVGIIKLLAERDASFLDRFAALEKHGQKRRYIAHTKTELYPGRPDLAQKYANELLPDWWIGVNYSKENIARIIERACQVAGLQYGADIQINLGQ
jgi:predicted type IV restriction endonuclease